MQSLGKKESVWFPPAKYGLTFLPLCQQNLVGLSGGGLAGHYHWRGWVWVELMYATTLTNYLHLEK